MGHTPELLEGPSKEFRYVQMLVNVDCKSSYININIIYVIFLCVSPWLAGWLGKICTSLQLIKLK